MISSLYRLRSAAKRDSNVNAPAGSQVPVYGAAVIAFLCAFTDVKFADVQPLEVFAICYIPVVFGYKLATSTHFVKIAYLFSILFLLMFVGSVASLRLEFFVPGDFGVLKTPPYASFIRLFQIALAFSTFFLVGLAAIQNGRNADLVLKGYVLGGLLSAAWAAVSLAAYFVGYDFTGAYIYGGVLRTRGFFVEGGPFGVYLVGVLLAVNVRQYLLGTSTRTAYITTSAILFIALVASQSKAAVVLVGVLLALYLYFSTRISLAFAGVLALIPLATTSNFTDRVTKYYVAASKLESEIRRRPEDTNYIMGRLAATVILPRIVEAHPVIGVGVGNYSLVRNDPTLLQGLPQVHEWDLHGMGLLGYLAELGIPLTLFLLWLYSYPFRVARSIKRNRKRYEWLSLFSIYPLGATLLGAQINFAYPWVVSGIAVAIAGIILRRQQQQQISMHRLKGDGAQRPSRRSALAGRSCERETAI